MCHFSPYGIRSILPWSMKSVEHSTQVKVAANIRTFLDLGRDVLCQGQWRSSIQCLTLIKVWGLKMSPVPNTDCLRMATSRLWIGPVITQTHMTIICRATRSNMGEEMYGKICGHGVAGCRREPLLSNQGKRKYSPQGSSILATVSVAEP